MSCYVINCARRFEKGSGITFLRIPDREPKRSAWIDAIRRKNWVPSEHERVCSENLLSGKFQFRLMLSVEKCHKKNFGFGVLLFYHYFQCILLFLFRHSAIAAKSRAYSFFRACITFVKLLSSRTNNRRSDCDPDYVPNLLMGYMEEGCFERCQKKKARYLPCLRRSEIKEKAKED